MGIDVTAFGLSILLTSRYRDRERVFNDVNRLGRPKAVPSIPILLGHCIQLRLFVITLISTVEVFNDFNRIGRPKTVPSIPIFLGHYRLLRLFVISIISTVEVLKEQCLFLKAKLFYN